MWFKKHFYEKSLRIPLIMYAPWIQAQRVSELVSLVDLLPTFNGLASGQPWHDSSATLEGTDLTAMFDRSGSDSEYDRAVYAEYLAEATTVPLFMIRRGKFKFVYSSSDPYLLFDVENDPNELVNLAADKAYESIVQNFEREAPLKWNSEALAEKIRLSQQRRILVRAAVNKGAEVRWNHNELPGESVSWYRGKGTYNDWAFDYLPVKNG